MDEATTRTTPRTARDFRASELPTLTPATLEAR